MRSEADVVQACIDVYGDRTDRAERLVERSLRVRPQLPALGGGGGGEHPDVLRHPRDALRTRPRAAALGRPVPRADHRPVRRRVRPLLRRDRRPLAARPARAPRSSSRARCVLARESAGRRSHAAQLAGALLGELHYVRGELDEAERLLDESGELGAESGVVDFMIASYVAAGAHQGGARRDRRGGGAARRGREGRRTAGPGPAAGRRRRGTVGQMLAPAECARPTGWPATCRRARRATTGSA